LPVVASHICFSSLPTSLLAHADPRCFGLSPSRSAKNFDTASQNHGGGVDEADVGPLGLRLSGAGGVARRAAGGGVIEIWSVVRIPTRKRPPTHEIS